MELLNFLLQISIFGIINSQITFNLKKHHSEDFRKLQATFPVNPISQGFSFTIGLGNPPQIFRVLMDTGSSDLWVADSSQTSYGANNLFKPTLSSTYVNLNKPQTISYGDGSQVEGVTSSDFLYVGGLSVPNFNFLLANKPGSGFSSVKNTTDNIDGTIGMSADSTNFVSKLFNMSLIPSNMFSIILGSNPKVTIGGSAYSTPVYYNKIPDYIINQWIVIISGLKSSLSRFNFNDTGLVDTGAVGLVLLPSMSNNISSLISTQTCNLQNSRLTCNCPSNNIFPDIAFIIGGQGYLVKSSDYFTRTPQNSMCTVSFSFTDLGTVILGTMFLNNYYTVYDIGGNQIGFGEANYQIVSKSVYLKFSCWLTLLASFLILFY